MLTNLWRKLRQQDRVEELEQYRARTEFILAGLRTVLDTTPEQVDRLARLEGQPETVDRLRAILDEEDR